MIITIDGPAACGKGTLAREIARKLGFKYFSTGYAYRALAYILRERSINREDTNLIVSLARKLELSNVKPLFEPTLLETQMLGQDASKISVIPEIRAEMVRLQREFVGIEDYVVDGRDAGTTIFPSAICKIYIDASLQVRADRRYKQLQTVDKQVIYQEVYDSLERRDLSDTTREASPLRIAGDAFVIDTTDMSKEAVLHEAMKFIKISRSSVKKD